MEQPTRKLIYYGNSMRGVFVNGDDITAHEVDFATPQVGDILVFASPERPDHLIIHRVIERSAEYILTQGDNNFEADLPIASDWHIKMVTTALRNGTEVKFNSGAAGLRDFNRRQRFKKLWRAAVWVARYPARLAPLRFFASAKELEYSEFKRGGVVVKALVYRGKTPVAQFDFKHRCWLIASRWKLYYPAKTFAKFTPSPEKYAQHPPADPQ